jgi:hypothetical protein
MTTTSVSSSGILQQIQSLNSSQTNQTPAVADFTQALQVSSAGAEVLSADLSQDNAAAVSSQSASSQASAAAIFNSPSVASSTASSSTAATNAATLTDMLATAQAAQPSTATATNASAASQVAQSTFTPTTFWSQAIWDTSPYNPANNACSSSVSQTVNGVQIIPGAPGWNANSSALQGIYLGIQSTWDGQEGMAVPQNVQSSMGTNNWTDSPYNPASGAGARGVSHLVDGVQVIPGAPGWDPGNPALSSAYAGMQGTWNMLNSMTPTSA